MDRLQELTRHLTGLPGQPSSGVNRNNTDSQQIQHAQYKARTGLLNREQYEAMYRRSIEHPVEFWGEIAGDLHWQRKWERDHFDFNFDTSKGPVTNEWFQGGRTNLAYNCLDRHVKEGRGNQACLLWEGNELSQSRKMTYKQVLDEVSRLGNWLRSVGVRKGDAVAIYMPMVCELPIAMLACARIGAVHSIIFGGFSAESLAQRMENCKSRVLITASGTKRGSKSLNLKQIADKAMQLTEKNGFSVDVCLVYKHPDVPERDFKAGRDVWWHQVISKQSPDCKVEWMDSEDPLFLLYTSGSTGQPKGVLHTTGNWWSDAVLEWLDGDCGHAQCLITCAVGGYMVMAYATTKYCFDVQPGDVYWCTADCGWITGHTYLAYGPLLNGATNVVYEGVPNYPDPGRCWQIVAKHKVRVFYTAPTLIRSLEAADVKYVCQHDRSSLAVLGTVGEPINLAAWQWYHEVVGEGRCPIIDSWWQTETGAAMLVPLPGAWEPTPTSATLPFFGVAPVLLDEKGKELEGEAEGILCIKQSWPSILRTVYGDHKRFEETYFSAFKGYYFAGDGARRDKKGYYYITGRVDDVINVSGHRVGTAEVESAVASNPKVAEAAVVGFDHKIKGMGIYCYVLPANGVEPSDALKKELSQVVRQQIGAFAAPDVIHWVPGLPKTRSGKIMRRILRKIAVKQDDQLGDVSTLAGKCRAKPAVVDGIIKMRGK
eukprot:jgi/Astpho2/7593/Aster-02498